MTNQQPQQKYEFGMVGLGVMGRNLLPNMADHGFAVAGYDKDETKVEALTFGKTPEEMKAEGTSDWLVSHRVFEGNRPSNVLLADRLTPELLGKLVVLDEHSVFTQGVIWRIDSSDQWGVELGKVLAQQIIRELDSKTQHKLKHDSSTDNLNQRYRKMKGVL